jgi:hypothetical protein
MKWFVTDAQLVAIRREAEDLFQAIADTAAEGHAAEIERLTARFDAERALWRTDREAELARLADPSADFVAHLKDEIAFARHQVLHERQRAEVAIDQCRVTHQGIGPVSLPLRDDAVTHTGTPADIFRDPELAAMGLADGLAP